MINSLPAALPSRILQICKAGTSWLALPFLKLVNPPAGSSVTQADDKDMNMIKLQATKARWEQN